jgi:phage replication-related protein YjqB (UPF0714/DUF867 family)
MFHTQLEINEEESIERNKKYQDFAAITRKIAEKHGLTRKQHIRIENGKHSAYYRIWKILDNGREADAVKIHKKSAPRLDAKQGDKVEVYKEVPNRDTREEAYRKGGLHEELKDDGRQSQILVTAVHGGNTESYTRHLADRLYDKFHENQYSVSLWKLQGYVHDDLDTTAHRVWHTSMVMKSPKSYPKLQKIVDRDFELVVGFHRQGAFKNRVGGRIDKTVRKSIADKFKEYTGSKAEVSTVGTDRMVSENYLADSRDRALHLECRPKICNYQGNRRSVVDAVFDVVTTDVL